MLLKCTAAVSGRRRAALVDEGSGTHWFGMARQRRDGGEIRWVFHAMRVAPVTPGASTSSRESPSVLARGVYAVNSRLR
jgi:hypothetical protein